MGMLSGHLGEAGKEFPHDLLMLGNAVPVMAAQGIFVEGIGRGGNHEAMGIFDVIRHLLLVDEIARLAVRGLFPGRGDPRL